MMRDYNSKCQPPWKDSELKHKVDEAFKLVVNRDGGSRNGTH